MKRKKKLYLKNKQKGASMIVLALIIMIFTAIMVISVTKLTISEKKRTDAIDTSAKAYQKADEAAECALWARKTILERQNDREYQEGQGSVTQEYIFPRDLRAEYCSDYMDKIEMFHENPGDWPIEEGGETAWSCVSPLWILGFLTEGESQWDDPTGSGTKIRKIGATADVLSGTSGTIRPFVTCNRLAEKGVIKDKYRNPPYNCYGRGLTDDQGPENNDRGWLGLVDTEGFDYWNRECGGICLGGEETEADGICAYYNTALTHTTDLIPTPSIEQPFMWYDFDGVEGDKAYGAHWCWTDTDLDTEATGSLCYCMREHTVGTDDAKYWKHPDIAGASFCSVCKRLEASERINLGIVNDCAGSGTGGTCENMANNIGIDNVSEEVWGSSGKPDDSLCYGEIPYDYCYACNCPIFAAQNNEWCNDADLAGGCHGSRHCGTP